MKENVFLDKKNLVLNALTSNRHSHPTAFYHVWAGPSRTHQKSSKFPYRDNQRLHNAIRFRDETWWSVVGGRFLKRCIYTFNIISSWKSLDWLHAAYIIFSKLICTDERGEEIEMNNSRRFFRCEYTLTQANNVYKYTGYFVWPVLERQFLTVIMYVWSFQFVNQRTVHWTYYITLYPY